MRKDDVVVDEQSIKDNAGARVEIEYYNVYELFRNADGKWAINARVVFAGSSEGVWMILVHAADGTFKFDRYN